MTYENMAPNTAMLSRVPPITAVLFSCPSKYQSVNMTASAVRLPSAMAICGVLRTPCVTERPGGK